MLRRRGTEAKSAHPAFLKGDTRGNAEQRRKKGAETRHMSQGVSSVRTWQWKDNRNARKKRIGVVGQGREGDKGGICEQGRVSWMICEDLSEGAKGCL